ncbi:uncharacterized protein L203_102324 [Cryptococcus depauperatus CBS 7841]|uniref:Uncharacterized protein n=1 Tax=Cryptococcus depauperatus CBS 7841 TaxID=1295531 RepID=A0AAJ8M0K2_9TREE
MEPTVMVASDVSRTIATDLTNTHPLYSYTRPALSTEWPTVHATGSTQMIGERNQTHEQAVSKITAEEGVARVAREVVDSRLSLKLQLALLIETCR